MNNYTNYDVAVINYPLMDPRIKPNDYLKYFQLEYISMDKWKVPVYIHIPFCRSICKFCIYHRHVGVPPPIKTAPISRDLIYSVEPYNSISFLRASIYFEMIIPSGSETCL